MNLVGKKKAIHRRKKKYSPMQIKENNKKNNIQKFTYVSMYTILHQVTGVFKCKNQGRHK